MGQKWPFLGAQNWLHARRLIERGSRFVQLYHTHWDSHGGPGENLNSDFEKVCKDVDQASATLVIWGGEFGRTPMGENRKSVGRDHSAEFFAGWVTVPA